MNFLSNNFQTIVRVVGSVLLVAVMMLTILVFPFAFIRRSRTTADAAKLKMSPESSLAQMHLGTITLASLAS